MWNTIAACKEVAERDALAEHLIHKRKLGNIKARINNKPPKPMPHVRQKEKKKLEEIKNLADIHHNNQILLDKLEKVKTSIRKNKKSYSNQPRMLSRAKFEEIMKIDDENNRIMNKIQSVTSQYSAVKHERDYVFSKYLANKLSQNARRIPRISSYNTLEINDFAKSQRSSRPATSAGDGGSGRYIRPISAKLIKQEL